MNSDERGVPIRLEELGTAECLRLAASLRSSAKTDGASAPRPPRPRSAWELDRDFCLFGYERNSAAMKPLPGD